MMDSIISIDIFAKKPQLRLPTGQKKYNTFIGCMCTLLYVVLLLGCAYFIVTDCLDLNKKMRI